MTEAREVPPMDKWRCVKTDPPPKDGSWILLCGGSIDDGWCETNTPPVVCAQYTPDGIGKGRWQFAWYDSGYYGEYESPTHWRFHPTPPQEPTHG